MTHDPLCPFDADDSMPVCACGLIARVREDERGKWAKVTDKPDSHALGVYLAGRTDALRDAVEAVKALPLVAAFTGELAIIRRPQAVAAIEALGGER